MSANHRPRNHAAGLHETLRFKFSCRSDEVREEVLAPLIQAGLTHVYLGVEAGDPDSLKTLNKHFTPEVHFRAGDVLRHLDISFDFGFMLMEPWSTLSSMRNNLTFLREFCSQSYTVGGFGRTLPYVGTPMEQRMRAQGRLTGPALEADYRFLGPRLDVLWDFSVIAFAAGTMARMGSPAGLAIRSAPGLSRSTPRSAFRTAARTLTAVSQPTAKVGAFLCCV